ncbi:four helix bundle protein [bacterium]|nr:four helix bundle protein [bacterium]
MLLKISRFEDLESWKAARILVNFIYTVSRQNLFAKDFKLSSQIQSASVSVMSNIAEGFDRRSDKEFVRFLEIASASATEVQSQLYVALDQHYMSEDEFRSIYDHTTKTKQLIFGFMRYLTKTSDVGHWTSDKS